MISFFDLILILFLAGWFFYGIYNGLIKAVGYVAGLIIGAWFATHFYLQTYEWLKWAFFGHENLGKIVSFIIVLAIINRLVALVFYVIEKIFDFLSIIPFTKTINRLAGGAFGLLEGALTLGLIIYVASRYALVNSWLSNLLLKSVFAVYLAKLSSILSPLFPQALKVLQSIFQ